MYRHCLFCQQDLGTNEVVESLPIGRRLAFDESKGRLWVICRKCERWNLTPFDARWEAIAECERQFRATKLRVSTDNIGLARISEGLELVRIGQPLRPEMASWRYGDQFGRRRKRHALIATAGVASVGAVVGGLLWTGLSMAVFGNFATNLYKNIIDRANRSKIATSDGRLVYVLPSKAINARLKYDRDSDRIVLSLKAGHRIESWIGDDARVAASIVLPRANAAGAAKADVQRAVELMSVTRVVEDPLGSMLGRHSKPYGNELRLKSLSTAQRLALEMALHEEEERRALHGELRELELRWQAAEEIATIADSLTLPDSVEQQYAALKGREDAKANREP